MIPIIDPVSRPELLELKDEDAEVGVEVDGETPAMLSVGKSTHVMSVC
jgi:hypothetical protein